MKDYEKLSEKSNECEACGALYVDPGVKGVPIKVCLKCTTKPLVSDAWLGRMIRMNLNGGRVI